MAKSFTLKNIPEDLYERIKARAERNHRSVNGEIIAILDETAGPRSRNVAGILALADELRSHTKGPLSDEFIGRAKREGRP
jgi:plasmid stability protein